MKTKFFGVNEIYATGFSSENGHYYLDMNVQSNTNSKNEDVVIILDKHQINQINKIQNFYSIMDINNWIINNDELINKLYKQYKKNKIKENLPYLSLIGFSLMTYKSFQENNK
jgi:hypothetical protein